MELLLRTLTPTPLNPTATPLLHLPSTLTSVSFKRPLYSSPKLTAATVSSLRPSVAASSASAAVASSRWLVVMEKPPLAASSRADVIDYYVRTLAGVLPSEKDAQMCIYRAEWQGCYAFCCDIDEEASRRLAGMPGVLSVVPDNDLETKEKDYSYSNILSATQTNSDVLPSRFSPSLGNCKYWLVKLEKPGVEVVTKAQMVDYFVLILTKVLGNEKDAQVCIYNISWEKDFGFCCQIDKECAQELSDVPGVLSVQPDVNFESVNKDYKGGEINRERVPAPEPLDEPRRIARRTTRRKSNPDHPCGISGGADRWLLPPANRSCARHHPRASHLGRSAPRSGTALPSPRQASRCPQLLRIRTRVAPLQLDGGQIWICAGKHPIPAKSARFDSAPTPSVVVSNRSPPPPA